MDQYQGATNTQVPALDQSTLAAKVQRLKELDEGLTKLASLAEGLADRLVGSRPEKAGPGGPAPVPNGLVENIGDLTGRLEIRRAQIYESLARIESRLG